MRAAPVRGRAALLLALLACAASGCTSDADRMPEITGGTGAEPEVRFDGAPPGSVTSTTVSKGTGEPVGPNDLVVAQMSTFPWAEGGKAAEPEFSSRRLKTDVLLSAAEFAAIAPGEEKALVGRPEGSRVAIFVPPSAADGGPSEDGDPASGGLHVIDITGTYASAATVPGKASAPDDPALPEVTDSAKGPRVSVPDSAPPKKTTTADLITGDGPEIAKGDRVVVQFTGVLWDGGKVFDGTWEYGGRPTAFSLGTDQVVPAWDDALIGRPVGSRVLVVAPPGEAYGSAGNPGADIPSGSTLVYVIDVLGRH